ncbi:hypothetical protein CDFC105_72924 [Clostridioides difficile]|nr:hypothetical protein CDFC105_64144 [Clostridioides difficile]CZS08827.1 hypothetical protein CDFC105_72924 [Clostridioides difficile]
MESKAHELTEQDLQRLIEGLRADPVIAEMVIGLDESGIAEICEKMRNKIINQSKKDYKTRLREGYKEIVASNFKKRVIFFETPEQYTQLIVNIVDTLVSEDDLTISRACGALHDVEKLLPLIVTF